MIICDVQDNNGQFDSEEEHFVNNSTSKKNLSGEQTMIVHRNEPSGENMIFLGDVSKHTERSNSSGKAYKRSSKTTKINDTKPKSDQFKRVESTSSYKNLPNLQKIQNP